MLSKKLCFAWVKDWLDWLIQLTQDRVVFFYCGFEPGQRYHDCQKHGINRIVFDKLNSSYWEHDGEVSSSSFPNFQGVVIDSCDNMLVP